MLESWRLLDTGLASAARNIALSRALLEARRADEISSTLRFWRCTRAALLGHFQSAEQELDLAFCRSHNITVQRRITGGPAMYVDETQLGWELYLHRRDIGKGDMQQLVRRVCHAAATALSALGVDARYRRPDEVEIDGRSLCTTGCTADGDAVLLQAVLWLDTDSGDLARVYRGPPVTRAGTLALPPRTTGLKAELGRKPGVSRVRDNLVEAFESEFAIEFREGELSLTEQRRCDEALRAVDTPQWVDLVKTPAGARPITEAVQAVADATLRAAVAFEPDSGTICKVWLASDVDIRPARTLRDLEAALRDVPIARLGAKVDWFFRSRPADLGALSPQDVVTVVRRALGQPLVA